MIWYLVRENGYYFLSFINFHFVFTTAFLLNFTTLETSNKNNNPIIDQRIIDVLFLCKTKLTDKIMPEIKCIKITEIFAATNFEG